MEDAFHWQQDRHNDKTNHYHQHHQYQIGKEGYEGKTEGPLSCWGPGMDAG
jgi:hypothetical protein